MKLKKIGKIFGGQDGAIWNEWLFRFHSRGACHVYNIKGILDKSEPVEIERICKTMLDIENKPVPHVNTAVFGTEYYEDGDEFPLLYVNVYNNYINEEDQLRGTVCVYRIKRDGNDFSFELKQLVKLGFAYDNIWCSETGDLRPFGNFVIDRDTNKYYGFNMMDGPKITRYFAFDLPKKSDGVFDEKWGVNVVTLEKSDILFHFDCDYHYLIQGACMHKGLIYSLEGSVNPVEFPWAMRIIDPKEKKQVFFTELKDLGTELEPEMIDFADGICYYSDGQGNLFTIEF